MPHLPLKLKFGEKCHLVDLSPEPETKNIDKAAAKEQIGKNSKVIIDLARKLYAENRRALLLVLQGMDTSGKDGTIRTIMKGVNPQSCIITSFKKPTETELAHDYLWRVHQAVPKKGFIGVFNRSQYEDLLIVRVHNLVPKAIWSKRFDQINDFERLLTESGTTVVKCFLHIDKETQRRRLQDRIDNPEDHWKFNPVDLEERKIWDEYQLAYDDVITKCNTAHAPWYIVPSNRKWYRNLVVSNLLRNKLEELKPNYPLSEKSFESLVVE